MRPAPLFPPLHATSIRAFDAAIPEKRTWPSACSDRSIVSVCKSHEQGEPARKIKRIANAGADGNSQSGPKIVNRLERCLTPTLWLFSVRASQEHPADRMPYRSKPIQVPDEDTVRVGPPVPRSPAIACTTGSEDLSRDSVRLLLALRVGPQVPALATGFPHVLNRLAQFWRDPRRTEAYLAELLLTDRSGRKGFSAQVVAELTLLRERNRRRIPPPLVRDVWQELAVIR
jgi:hypothetical protein